MPSLSARINLDPEGKIGPGKIELLEKIASLGSISAAGRAMDMSYKRAWELVEETNQIFGKPVAVRRAGGKRGGGATLTPFGLVLVARFRAIEREGNVTFTSHFLFALPSDLLTAQLNRSLLQFSLAGMGRTPLTPDDLDGTVETAVANLGNFDWGAATKMGAFKRFDLTSPSPKLDLQRKDLASGLSQGVPVSVTDQGVRVGLFSIGSDGGSLFSSSASGVTSEMTTNAGSGVDAATNGFGTGVATQTVAQPLNTVTS